MIEDKEVREKGKEEGDENMELLIFVFGCNFIYIEHINIVWVLKTSVFCYNNYYDDQYEIKAQINDRSYDT